MAKKSRFFPAAAEKMVQNKKYFGFFLFSYLPIQKKKCTSEQFLQGPRGGEAYSACFGPLPRITSKNLFSQIDYSQNYAYSA